MTPHTEPKVDIPKLIREMIDANRRGDKEAAERHRGEIERAGCKIVTGSSLPPITGTGEYLVS